MEDENTKQLIIPNELIRPPPSMNLLRNPQPLDEKDFPNPPRTKKSQVPATISNIEYMLDKYGIIVRYNIIKKKIEIIIPEYIGTTDNIDNVTLTIIISLSVLNRIQTTHIPEYIFAIADKNQINPIADWITGTPWDGQNRLPDIYATIIEREGYSRDLKNILMYKWLLSAIAAVLKPTGFKARGVLTLQGQQGIGKTSWIKSLIPDVLLREMAIKVDHHLDGNNKDSIIGAVSHWIVEIGELDSSFKKDIARLKGFLTSDSDKVRRPYARMDSEYQRRTIFFASVNQANFLVDMTGNSRWWTIPVTAINYNHGIDMQQLFAQLALDYNNGSVWWLNAQEEELLDSYNKDHLSVSIIRERLLEEIDPELKGEPSNPYMSAIEVLTMLGFERPTNPQCKECAAVLREMFGDPKKIKGSMKWRIPEKRGKNFSHVPSLNINY